MLLDRYTNCIFVYGIIHILIFYGIITKMNDYIDFFFKLALIPFSFHRNQKGDQLKIPIQSVRAERNNYLKTPNYMSFYV